MPPLTPQRIRLTLLQKVKIIEESKKPQVRSHLQSLGENSQVFDALKSIERVFIKKSIEESHTKQTKVSNFFPTTQLVLR